MSGELVSLQRSDRGVFHEVGCVLAVCLVVAACARAPRRADGVGQVRAVYDPATGRLQHLLYDADANGYHEMRAELDGTLLIRVEIDSDQDGTFERREDYGRDQKLQTVVGARASEGGAAETIVRAAAEAGITASLIPVRLPEGASR